MSSELQHAVEHLYGLERRRSEFRVEDTARVLEALGRPQDRFRSVHVAGTNGKGSVCALVERVLRAEGVRTGLYTSPHLVDFRERIRVQGRWLEERELQARLEWVRGLEAARGRTFFEITTALGFDAFARQGVEWAVVEVGLGGRLDATNVLAPAVCAIGSVGLDHTEMLGETLTAVAHEKAGIIKSGTPVVAGDLPWEARAAARWVARERGAPWVASGDRVRLRGVRTHASGASLSVEASPWGALELELSLRGAHQVENARVALAILGLLAERELSISGGAVREGFGSVRWPGRLEPCALAPRLWWDGAHNLDGVRRLVSAWRSDLRLDPPEAIVFAVSRDKDTAGMVAELRRLAPGAAFYATHAGHDRALPAERLGALAAAAGWAPRRVGGVERSARDALVETRGRVLLAGSLFAVGEAMSALGGAPGASV